MIGWGACHSVPLQESAVWESNKESEVAKITGVEKTQFQEYLTMLTKYWPRLLSTAGCCKYVPGRRSLPGTGTSRIHSSCRMGQLVPIWHPLI
jgi:hypothetical protein